MRTGHCMNVTPPYATFPASSVLPTTDSPMSPTTTVQDTSNESFVDKKMEQAYGAKLINCVQDGVETR